VVMAEMQQHVVDTCSSAFLWLSLERLQQAIRCAAALRQQPSCSDTPAL
jgi:hypothetical protein